MKIQIDIHSASNGFINVDWPEGTPVPAVGDHVMWRRQQITWSFNVTKRVMGIGTDVVDKGLMTQLSLTVDGEPPEGFQPHFQHPPTNR